MDSIPQYPDETAMPFYEGRFAKIFYGTTSVTAQDFTGSHDIALPMSVLWMQEVKCDGANIGGDGDIDFEDVKVLAQYWLDSPCAPPNWCGGADIDMSKEVAFPDFAILAGQWLNTNCD
jgi:hypothetical protein